MKYNEYFEESLKPVAYTDRSIISFQEVERRIYQLSDNGYAERNDTIQTNAFTLPGLDLIIKITVNNQKRELNIINIFSLESTYIPLPKILSNCLLRYIVYSHSSYCLLFLDKITQKYYLTDSSLNIQGIYSLPDGVRPLLYIDDKILFSNI